MAIIDAMSMAIADIKLKDEILSKVVHFHPDTCLSCMKCTSGCPAFRYLEFRPDRVISMIKLGFIEELLSSEIIWQCAQCLKCTERCPQDVAPSDVVLMLRGFCLRRGLSLPETLNGALGNILESGWAQKPAPVVSRKYETHTRKELGLSEVKTVSEKFKEILLRILESGG
jgi:heterodisulfide reductase subunit C